MQICWAWRANNLESRYEKKKKYKIINIIKVLEQIPPRTLKGSHLCIISFTVNPPMLLKQKQYFSINHILRNINKLKSPTYINFKTQLFIVKQQYRMAQPRHYSQGILCDWHPQSTAQQEWCALESCNNRSPERSSLGYTCSSKNTTSTETLKWFWMSLRKPSNHFFFKILEHLHFLLAFTQGHR